MSKKTILLQPSTSASCSQAVAKANLESSDFEDFSTWWVHGTTSPADGSMHWWCLFMPNHHLGVAIAVFFACYVRTCSCAHVIPMPTSLTVHTVSSSLCQAHFGLMLG